jgi:hypothetical protein
VPLARFLWALGVQQCLKEIQMEEGPLIHTPLLQGSLPVFSLVGKGDPIHLPIPRLSEKGSHTSGVQVKVREGEDFGHLHRGME